MHPNEIEVISRSEALAPAYSVTSNSADMMKWMEAHLTAKTGSFGPKLKIHAVFFIDRISVQSLPPNCYTPNCYILSNFRKKIRLKTILNLEMLPNCYGLKNGLVLFYPYFFENLKRPG